MLYALRRVDTRQLFAGFELKNHKMTPKWTNEGDGVRQVFIYDGIDNGMIEDLDRLENIQAVFVPVTIGG